MKQMKPSYRKLLLRLKSSNFGKKGELPLGLVSPSIREIELEDALHIEKKCLWLTHLKSA